MNKLMSIDEYDINEKAMKGFAELMSHVCRLYTCSESSSVSEYEGHRIAESILYVLDFDESNTQAAMELLSSDDVIATWTRKRRELEEHIPSVMELWQLVVSTMPSIHNIALRDTLASIGELPRLYDTFFAAHEVPCKIDYPLSMPVSEKLKGLDYIEAWLEQVLKEARFLARYDTKDMTAHLEAWCPDYRGLLINLYDPIHEAWGKQ